MHTEKGWKGLCQRAVGEIHIHADTEDMDARGCSITTRLPMTLAFTLILHIVYSLW